MGAQFVLESCVILPVPTDTWIFNARFIIYSAALVSPAPINNKYKERDQAWICLAWHIIWQSMFTIEASGPSSKNKSAWPKTKQPLYTGCQSSKIFTMGYCIHQNKNFCLSFLCVYCFFAKNFYFNFVLRVFMINCCYFLL